MTASLLNETIGVPLLIEYFENYENVSKFSTRFMKWNLIENFQNFQWEEDLGWVRIPESGWFPDPLSLWSKLDLKRLTVSKKNSIWSGFEPPQEASFYPQSHVMKGVFHSNSGKLAKETIFCQKWKMTGRAWKVPRMDLPLNFKNSHF